MPKAYKKGLTEDHVLRILTELRLISEDQHKDIFNKKRNIKRKLEQLRALEHGHRIKVVITRADSPAVDSPEDLAKIEPLLEPV